MQRQKQLPSSFPRELVNSCFPFIASHQSITFRTPHAPVRN